MAKIRPRTRFCTPLLGPYLRHFPSDFKKQSNMKLRALGPIFRVPIFLVPIFGRSAILAPKGLPVGPQKPPKMLAHWGSLTAPLLTRNQFFLKFRVDPPPLNTFIRDTI